MLYRTNYLWPSNKKQHKDMHGMIWGDLKVQVQDDSGDLRAVNCSPGVSYWPLNKCNLGSCTKPVLEITQRTKGQYSIYVKHTIHSKTGCNVELQTNEESARCGDVENISKHKNDSRWILEWGGRRNHHCIALGCKGPPSPSPPEDICLRGSWWWVWHERKGR